MIRTVVWPAVQGKQFPPDAFAAMIGTRIPVRKDGKIAGVGPITGVEVAPDGSQATVTIDVDERLVYVQVHYPPGDGDETATFRTWPMPLEWVDPFEAELTRRCGPPSDAIIDVAKMDQVAALGAVTLAPRGDDS